MQVSLHRPVKYRNATGSLVITPEAMTFSADEEDDETAPAIVEEWNWKQLDKATANKAGSKTDRLRVTLQQQEATDPILFSFPNRQELERVKTLVKQRIKEADAAPSPPMNDNSQSERWEDSMTISERWPEPAELHKIEEEEEVVAEEKEEEEDPGNIAARPNRQAEADQGRPQSASSNEENHQEGKQSAVAKKKKKRPSYKTADSDDDFSTDTRQTQKSNRPVAGKKMSSSRTVDSDDDFSADTRQTQKSNRPAVGKKRNSYRSVESEDDFSVDTRQSQRRAGGTASKRAAASRNDDDDDDDDSQFSSDTLSVASKKSATKRTVNNDTAAPREQSRSQWLPKPIQERDEEYEDEPVPPAVASDNNHIAVQNHTTNGNHSPASSNVYPPQAPNQVNTTGMTYPTPPDAEMGMAAVNKEESAAPSNNNNNNSQSRCGNMSQNRKRQIIGGSCCCCCIILVVVVLQVVLRVAVHSSSGYFDEDGIIIVRQTYTGITSARALEICQDASSTTSFSSISYYEPGGFLRFGEPRAKVNCDKRRLEIDGGEKLDLPACHVTDDRIASRFDCVDQDTQNDGRAFMRQISFRNDRCAVAGATWLPIGPIPTEVCMYDREFHPYEGSFMSSCTASPGKLVIYRWMTNDGCEGPSDSTTYLSLDEGACELQRDYMWDRDVWVQSMCSK